MHCRKIASSVVARNGGVRLVVKAVARA
jgi:hypothetical protein